MDAFHAKLAQIGLLVSAQYGFALAGGHAVNAHGFINRPSADVDLFAALDADPSVACKDIVAAYQREGLSVTIDHESRYYVRLTVADSSGQQSKVELVADVRLRDPVRMGIGPVLHPDDVAAGKVEALFSRAECRDYIDIDALLRSGQYTHEKLLSLAEQRDAGFDREVFAHMLTGVDRFPDAEFARYGVSADHAQAVRTTMHEWHARLAS